MVVVRVYMACVIALCVSEAVCMRICIRSREHCGVIIQATHAQPQYIAAVVHIHEPYSYVLCEGYDTSIVCVFVCVL